MPKPFRGVGYLDIRDSVPDRDTFTATSAPESAPNALAVLFDDAGRFAGSVLERADGDGWAVVSVRDDRSRVSDE
jgi:hypothetical protein